MHTMVISSRKFENFELFCPLEQLLPLAFFYFGHLTEIGGKNQ